MVLPECIQMILTYHSQHVFFLNFNAADEKRPGTFRVLAYSQKTYFKYSKTEYMVVGSKQRINSLVGDLTLSLNDISLRKVKSTKCLGVTIDEFLTWAEHIDNVIKKLAIGISLLRRNRKVLKKCDLMNNVYI